MNAIDTIAEAVRRTGYREEAIVRDYAFADVLDPGEATRTVSLAAFTQTPPSYRSAALAAVPGGHERRWIGSMRIARSVHPCSSSRNTTRFLCGRCAPMLHPLSVTEYR